MLNWLGYFYGDACLGSLTFLSFLTDQSGPNSYNAVTGTSIIPNLMLSAVKLDGVEQDLATLSGPVTAPEVVPLPADIFGLLTGLAFFGFGSISKRSA